MGSNRYLGKIGSRKSGRSGARKRTLLVLLGAVVFLVLADLALPAQVTFRFLARPMIQFYRGGLGKLWTHHCPSRPSCSAYALAAYEKHGLILGTLLTADRLMAEQGRMEEGPWITAQGRKYVKDSLEDNTFWWTR